MFHTYFLEVPAEETYTGAFSAVYAMQHAASPKNVATKARHPTLAI